MAGAVVWQRFEGLVCFVAGIALFLHWNDEMAWWSAVLIFFVPDLTFFGYLFGSKVGSMCYNLAHIYAFGIILLTIGIVGSTPIFIGCGALWLAHSGFDRMLGYGLKLPDSFSSTHLGRIGKQRFP
ncbi:hypothetical protein A6R70_04005 [Agrobacterium rubi]|uniref:DUF4260 domain-containing protein n=1 Tax=Agrobacterium rubi TaxID=28099 RepID=UPI0005EB0F23|nr:DUF4260 domain-containing protein [Agrobacterium rubi]MBP1877269.1 hypothetical protein [Agrobacterium rubi]MCL6651451.1 hypothetical protein [Agrobacterium rubi]